MIAVHIESGSAAIRQTPIPSRPPGFALLKLSLAGICNTDLELLRGYYSFSGIPGHEFVATVVECDRLELLHKRVVGEINLPCGHCALCLNGLPRHCSSRTVLGIVQHPGAFAEFLTLPEANLHVLPEEITNNEAVFVEPIAAACEILEQISLTSADHVAVLGDGKLGLLITQVLLAHNIPITVYGRHESKLEIARAAGAIVKPADQLPTQEFACVVECTGSASGLRSAISMAAPRGTVVMKSTVHEGVSVDTAPIIVNELTMIGSRCGPFEPAIELLKTKKVNVMPMISAHYALGDAPHAFSEAAQRGKLKVLLHNNY